MSLPSSLHARCMRFAKGIPSVNYSWNQLQAELDHLLAQPGVSEVQNVPLPVRGLRCRIILHSVDIFPIPRTLDALGLPNQESNGRLTFEATVEVYAPANLVSPGFPPADIILRRYKVRNPRDSNNDPIPYKIGLSLDGRSNEAFWEILSGSDCLISPEAWSTTATADLIEAGFAPAGPADPRTPEEIFEVDVQIPLLWTSERTFLNLIVSVLPNINLGQIAPWLSLGSPLKVDYADPTLIITAENALVAVKDECKSEIIYVQADPNFPQLPILPNPPEEYPGHVSVYIPSGVATQIHEKRLGSPIPVNDKGGGQINFRVNGQIALRPNRDPFALATTNAYNLPIMNVHGIAFFDGSARGCIDLFLGEWCAGSGRIYGDALFEGVLDIGFSPDGLNQTATIRTTRREHLDLNFPNDLPWPISDVKAAIDSMIDSNVVSRTFRRAALFNSWHITGIPDHYAQRSGDRRRYTLAEGYDGISILVGYSDEG